MKPVITLRDLIEIKPMPDLGGTVRRSVATIVFRRLSSVTGQQTDDELKTELLRDVMSKIGLFEDEIAELERRSQ